MPLLATAFAACWKNSWNTRRSRAWLSDAPRDKRTYFREINYIAAAFQYQKKNYNSA